MDLLRCYAEGDSESAFAALVARHVNLVYSAALRKTGQPDAATEITQAVFILLAQKARRIPRQTILAGWLYQTARLTASSFLKSEARRARREHEAYMQTDLHAAAPDETWSQLAPLLEDAMGHLDERERAAVVLRFFGDKSFAEVATAAGVTENAAKKRVTRALEKLHLYFSRRGVSSTTAMIAGMISANSVHAAPVGLAKSATALALAKGVTATTSTLTLTKGALKIMAWTKVKIAVIVGVAALSTVGTTAVVFHHNPAAVVDFFLFSRTQELTADQEAQYVKLTGTTPEAAAQAFFDACGRADWTEVAKYWEPGTPYPLNDRIQTYLGGLQVVHLGKPFWAWTRIHDQKFGGAFVPYEIRFKDGAVKKFQLQIRCDNPDHRWYVDGGL